MLAGGATPRPVYERLSSPAMADRVAWDRVAIFFGDERCVPPDNAASNYRMVRRSLFDRLPVAPAEVHRMRGEDVDRKGAAAAYAALLPLQIDVLLLGMGPDGHIASLFPGSPALGEAERRVVPVQGAKPSPWRLSITPPVIRGARSIIVLVAGAGKASMVARAVTGREKPEAVPASLARRGVWILDRGAASALPAGGDDHETPQADEA